MRKPNQKIIFYKYKYEGCEEDEWEEDFALVDDYLSKDHCIRSLREDFDTIKFTKPNLALLEKEIGKNNKVISERVERNTFLSDQIKILSKD